MRGLLFFAAMAAQAAASPQQCARCHKSETAGFPRSGMARALEAGIQATILKDNPTLAVGIGQYSYRISGGIYTVTDGEETLRLPIDWAFGQGSAGQTYVYRHDGRWYESRVSYFSVLKGLDITMGAQSIVPNNLVEAAGRTVGVTEAGQCFDCHATHVVKSPQLDISAMSEGVQCERCHGPADAHLKSVAPMRKLGKLSTEEMSDFCGQCHRTWSQISVGGPRGVQNVRFQPYRLANSKCYDAADSRIRCTTCHNPHRALETSVASYDTKCVACHTATGRQCPVSRNNCVTCHMPKTDLPGAHMKFTDHRIRIVRSGEQYPD